MGVDQGAKFLYSVGNLSPVELNALLSRRCRLFSPTERKPRIAVDANLLAFRLFALSGNVLTDPAALAERVLEFVSCFIGLGVDVLVVCDGPHRHHSKKATISRRTERHQLRVDCLGLKATLSRLNFQFGVRHLRDSMYAFLLRGRKLPRDHANFCCTPY